MQIKITLLTVLRAAFSLGIFLTCLFPVHADTEKMPILGGRLIPGATNTQLQNQVTRNEALGTLEVVNQRTAKNEMQWFQQSFLPNIIQLIMSFTATISVLVLIFGGYQYLTSMGDDANTGKDTILYACIGLIVSLLAYLAVEVALSLDFGPTNKPSNVPLAILQGEQ